MPSWDSNTNIIESWAKLPKTSPISNDYSNHHNEYLNKSLLDYVLINNRSINSKVISKHSGSETKYYSLNITSYPMKNVNRLHSVSTRKSTAPHSLKRRVMTADNLKIK